jgi:hypothetical protein
MEVFAKCIHEKKNQMCILDNDFIAVVEPQCCKEVIGMALVAVSQATMRQLLMYSRWFIGYSLFVCSSLPESIE